MVDSPSPSVKEDSIRDVLKKIMTQIETIRHMGESEFWGTVIDLGTSGNALATCDTNSMK